MGGRFQAEVGRPLIYQQQGIEVKIELNKVYLTATNHLVRIIAIDRHHTRLPVLGLYRRPPSLEEGVSYHRLDGYSEDSDLTIVRELLPWETTPIDAPVWVSDNNRDWYSRHFAGSKNSCPQTWRDGRTSHSSVDEDKEVWCHISLEKP